MTAGWLRRNKVAAESRRAKVIGPSGALRSIGGSTTVVVAGGPGAHPPPGPPASTRFIMSCEGGLALALALALWPSV